MSLSRKEKKLRLTGFFYLWCGDSIGLHHFFLAVCGFFDHPILETNYTTKGWGKRDELEEDRLIGAFFNLWHGGSTELRHLLPYSSWLFLVLLQWKQVIQLRTEEQRKMERKTTLTSAFWVFGVARLGFWVVHQGPRGASSAVWLRLSGKRIWIVQSKMCGSSDRIFFRKSIRAVRADESEHRLLDHLRGSHMEPMPACPPHGTF